MKAPMRLLIVASRPSDYVEMSALAQALGESGHHSILVYLYSTSDPGSAGIIQQMRDLKVASITPRAVSVDDVIPKAVSLEPQQPEAPSGPARQTWFQQLREAAIWLRGHGLSIYPKNTFVTRSAYAIARGLDGLRDPNRLKNTARMFRDVWDRLGEMPLMMRVDVARRVHQASAMVILYREFQEFFSGMIEHDAIDALLIPEDIVGNVWPVSIAAAHLHRVPALVLPYTLANEEEAIQSLKGAEAFQTSNNYVAARIYPRWRYKQKEIDIVRLPSSHIFAHEDLGISPPNPWMMNSGFSDRILVDSKASFDYFVAGGIPKEQLAIVGSVSQDRMFQQRRDREGHLRKLREELQLGDAKPLLLISGCPNQLTAPIPFCEFTKIEDVAAWVGECVAPLAEHYHLVVRPHPNFLEFGAMLSPFGVRSTTKPTANLVPLADLFVAFASATIRWAIACGIPTVNYDVFHYGYGDFGAAKSVQTVAGKNEFLNAVRALTPQSSALEAQAALAREDSAFWSLMDGCGQARIEEEIYRAHVRRKQPKELTNA